MAARINRIAATHFNTNPFGDRANLFGRTSDTQKTPLATPAVTIVVDPDGDDPRHVSITITPVANAGRYRVVIGADIVSNADVTNVTWDAPENGKYPVVVRAFPADSKTYKVSAANIQYVTVGTLVYLVTSGMKRLLANLKNILVSR